MNGGNVVIVSRGGIVSVSPLSRRAIIGDEIIHRERLSRFQDLWSPAEGCGIFRVIESDDRS